MPSTAAQVLITVIPIVGIVMGSVVLFFFLYWHHQQKVMLIEKGQYRKIEFDFDTFSLFAGLLLAGIESFKIIVERYQKKIFGIGMRFFKNRDDSYDFVQEVFIRAYESL